MYSYLCKLNHGKDLKRVWYHSHLLHLAHEFDEDPVEDLADTGQVCIRSGSEETEDHLYSHEIFLFVILWALITKYR